MTSPFCRHSPGLRTSATVIPLAAALALSPDSSVALTLEHFPGEGPQELGLDPHYAFGRSQVHPDDGFADHLLPFESALEAGVASINAGTDTLSGFHDVQTVLDLVEDDLVTEDRIEQAADD